MGKNSRHLDQQDLQATNIILNPGLAFGTGEHPTTKLCLLLLRRLIKGGEYFLDYGTGSGVLAIAALKVCLFKTSYIFPFQELVMEHASLNENVVWSRSFSWIRHRAAGDHIGTAQRGSERHRTG